MLFASMVMSFPRCAQVPIVDAVSASGLRPPAIETPATSMYQVLTGSGDGTIGVWAVQQDSWQLTYLGRMEGHSGSVYALQIVGSEVYSGKRVCNSCNIKCRYHPL